MSSTSNGEKRETYAALQEIVAALDKRFPDGNSAFQRVSRLAEECGELAAAVNHRENMGIKAQKHGEATDEHLVKELQDVLRATLGIARHYGVEDQLEQSIQEFYESYKERGFIF